MTFSNKYGFVVIDVVLKLFFFIFTYQTSLLLSSNDFDLLSYFRNTILMFVSLSTTSLGLYFLNYAKEFYGDKENHFSFVILPFLLFLVSILIFSFCVYVFSDLLKLSLVISREGLFVAIGIFYVMAFGQLSIIIMKSIGIINKKLVIYFLFITTINIIIGNLLIIKMQFHGAIYYLLFAYASIAILFYKNSQFKIYLGDIKINTVFIKDKLKVFIIPNFFESLLSIIAPWVALFILVHFNGMTDIGSLLFFQALLGLCAFFSYSLVLNIFNSLERTHIASALYIENSNNKYFYIALLIITILAIMSNELKLLFNLTSLSNSNLIFMLIATILQTQIIVISIVFKRMEMSSRTLLHNFIYSTLLIILSLAFIKLFGINGYGVSYFSSWLLVYIFILIDFRKYFQLNIKPLILSSAILITVFMVLFSSTLFIDFSIMAKVLILLSIVFFLTFIFLKGNNAFISKNY